MVVKPHNYYDLGTQGAYCRSVDACLGNTDNITVHAASFSLCGQMLCPGVESDHRMGDFRSPAFPFGYLGMDNATGLEPAKSGATIQRVYLSTTRYMVPRIGIEPMTHGLEGRCSTPLN